MTDERSSTVGPIDWEAVGRYLAGECSAAEAAAVQDWLATRPLDAELVARLDGAIQRVAGERVGGGPVDVELALQRVRARRDQPALSVSRGEVARRPAARWRTLGVPAIAAAAVLVVAVALWWRSRAGSEAQPTRLAVQTLETSFGERDSLRLPDGSVIQIGPQTRLVVAAGYGGSRREIELAGQAYFEVQHDEARPFVVRAGSAIVQDVGTTFTVEAVEAARVRVVVTTGLVSLRAAGDSSDSAAVLGEGDVGEVQPGRRVDVRRRAATPEDIAWIRGRLVFRDAPLTTVRSELRRWYGVELRVDDPALARKHLTVEFAGEPVDQVLRTIALTLGAELEQRGDTALLRTARRGALPR